MNFASFFAATVGLTAAWGFGFIVSAGQPDISIASLDSRRQHKSAAALVDSDVAERLDLFDRGGAPTAITAMAVDPRRGLIVVGTEDDNLQWIDAASMQTIGRIRGHRDRIRHLCFSPDGDRVASVGNDGCLQIWRVDEIDGAARLQRGQLISGTPALARVAFEPTASGAGTSRLIAVGFTEQIFRLGRNGSSTRPLRCEHGDLRAVAHDSRGRMFVGGRGGTVHVYPGQTQRTVAVSMKSRSGGEQSRCQTNSGAINDLAVMPSSGGVVCVCDHGTVAWYDTDDNRVTTRIAIGCGRLFAIEPIDSHRVAVAGSDDTIRIVDFSREKVTRKLKGHHGSVVDLAMIRGRLVSAGYDATVRVWSDVGDSDPEERP